jgi:serine protease Do
MNDRPQPRSQPQRRLGAVAAFVVVFLLIGGVAVFMAGRYTSGHSAAPSSPESPGSTPARAKPTGSPGAPGAGGFAALYRTDSSGVLKIVASTCGGTGVGTGFLLASGMVATVAHVVTGAVSVAVTGNGQTSAATVVGYDSGKDLALLRPSRAVSGYGFKWSSQQPSVGDQVAAIGYPLDQPETLTTGTVSGLNRKVPVEGTLMTGLIQTDTPINPGNSGGPLVATDGTVAGLIDATNQQASGIGYAVDAQAAQSEFSSWQVAPSPQPAGQCASATGPSGGTSIGGPASGSDATAIVATLRTYFRAVNSGDYVAAYAQMDANAQSQTSLQTLSSGDSTSYNFNFSLNSVTVSSSGVDVAGLDFTSVQDAAHGPDGNTCDNWTLNYTMVNTGGTWLIDSVTGQNGVTHSPC